MSFRTQIFTAILTICITSVLGMQLFLRDSIQDEFRGYLMKRESQQVEPLRTKLTKLYLEDKNWDKLKDFEFWMQLKEEFVLSNALVSSSNNSYSTRNQPSTGIAPSDNPDFDERFPLNTGPPNPDAEQLSRRKPLFLLDADSQLVIGSQWFTKQALLLPIYIDDNTVGYLGIPFRPELLDYPGESFLDGLDDHLLIITLIALLLAGITAIPISQFMVRRIQSLVYVLKQYSLGNFDMPVSTTGHDELSELAVHLSHLGDGLKKAEQNRKQWVADISHELRTPLAVLRADLEAMEDGVRKLDIAAVKRLHTQTGRLSTLIDDLYTLSLSDVGALTYQKVDCDLSGLLTNAIDDMKPEFDEAGFDFSFKVKTQKAICVLADPKRITQLIHNVLRNSLRYTHAPGIVEVTLELEDNQAVIVFSDSAPGVPSALHEKLFERLYRVDVSRSRHHGGAGLGLSLCRNIVTAHQGSIKVADSPLGGISVIVKLPLRASR